MKRTIIGKMMGILFVSLVVLLGGLVSRPLPVFAQNSPPDVTSIRVQSPNYSLYGSDLQVPGYGVNNVPGTPLLPVWSTIVELPQTGDWQISFQSVGSRLLAQEVDIGAVPVPDLDQLDPQSWTSEADLPAFVPTADRPDPAIYGASVFYPASPIVSGAVQWQAGRRLLALRVFPFQYNPVARRLRYHPDLQITVTVTPGEQSIRNSAPQTMRAIGTTNPAAMTEGALRIRTGSRGMYRLTYEDLVTAAVPLGTADPATFAMSYLGQPIDIEVTGDGDNLFEPGELVVFYAEPYQGRYDTKNVYWFTYGDAPGSRMETRTVAPTGGEPLITTITQTLHVEFDREYRVDYPRPRDADHWFDTPLSPDSATGVLTATRTYDLALDDALTSGNVSLRTALQGGADRPANPDKSIALRLNNHPVDAYQWEGKTYVITNTIAPASWLDSTPNRVSLVAAVSQLPGIVFYSVSPDWVELSYPALADAENNRIYIEGVTDGSNEVRVTGFSTPQVGVYDVRDPLQPVRLLTTQAVAIGGSYRLSFWDADLPGPTYFLSAESGLLAPLAIEPDVSSDWGTPNHEADYIAIVHSSLWAAIQPLLDHRTAEGLRVAKVDVQDIYDEFNFGRRDPEAIRSFLAYAYANWNGAGRVAELGAPRDTVSVTRPQYVLLVGDGHYDFTGVSGTTLPNLIPPYLIDIDPWMGETLADNRYVSIDGPDDYLPEMHIGRISAASPADVNAVVNKIIAYETAAPSGAWQQRVIFVADNDSDPAADWHAISDDVRLNWLPAGYDDRTIYYNRDYFTGTAMRAAVKAAFNDDAILLQWQGHSSRFRWASFTALNYDDPPTLNVNDTWPVTAHFTCFTGYFANLAFNRQSLGEILLLTPQRGSIADFSPSGLHLPGSLQVSNQGLVRALFQQHLERIGEAVDSARLFYFAQSGAYPDVIDTSMFFGDPATKLRLPMADLSASTASVSPNQAGPGDTLHYTIDLQNTGTFSATNVTVVMDYDDQYGQVTATVPAAVNAGGVVTWTLPILPPGPTQLTLDLQLVSIFPAGVTPIHAPLAVRGIDATPVDVDPTSEVSAAPQLDTSTLVASRDWAPPGYPVSYTVTLSNTGNAPSASTWLSITVPTDLVTVTSTSLLYDPVERRLTWQGPVFLGPPEALTFSGVVSPARSACGQLNVAAVLRDELAQVTPLTATVWMAVPDVNCDSTVNVVDVQQVARHWGAVQGGVTYHPRYDLDGDSVVSVVDIIIAAIRWE